jgi:hypothetical protein
MGKVAKIAATPLRRVTTAKEVVAVLGGNAAVCTMTGADFKSVYHWTGAAGMFPARYHNMMTKALRKRGFRAPASLWNQLEEKRAA